LSPGGCELSLKYQIQKLNWNHDVARGPSDSGMCSQACCKRMQMSESDYWIGFGGN
jgi:hypothetical protein